MSDDVEELRAEICVLNETVFDLRGKANELERDLNVLRGALIIQTRLCQGYSASKDKLKATHRRRWETLGGIAHAALDGWDVSHYLDP